MKNVRTLDTTAKTFFVTVSGVDGIPYVYEVGDYSIDEFGFLYLWEKSKNDERPIAMFNMGMTHSIDFSDEEPEVTFVSSVEELLDEQLDDIEDDDDEEEVEVTH